MDFYDEMRATATELLAPTGRDGLGQGSIQLVRYLAAPAPANPWDPPATPTRQVTVLSGIARGVGKELVGTPVENGGQIVATDLQVIVSPWGDAYEPTNVLEIDGKPVTILSVRNIPEAGTVCAIKFLVRQ